MTKKLNLLPCPFCGSNDVYLCSEAFSGYFCQCLTCSASGPTHWAADMSEYEDLQAINNAYEEWNKRAEK